MTDNPQPPCLVRVIASPTSWIEGEALRQLERTAQLPGMEVAVGLPDLHPGKGHPIGAAFASRGRIYPFLVGSDIGCGMALFATDLLARKAKRDRWVSRLDDLDEGWDGDVASHLASFGVESDGNEPSMGTIGGGNHFAELQVIDRVHDEQKLSALGLDASKLVLLVHSGSRGLGESILRAHIEKHGDAGLDVPSDEAAAYLARHDRAVRWAEANRWLIAARFAAAIGAEPTRCLDVCHNLVSPIEHGGTCHLHRKGAAPSDRGLVVIPGSRGHLSYLVEPVGGGAESGWSLAHGAGRKWTRADAVARLKGRVSPDQLRRTSLGSEVICEDRALLFEEAPEAYKEIERVVGDLVEAGLARVVAELKPLITYKTRSA